MNFVYWIRGEEYAGLAVRSAASVRKCYPAARVIVYADAAHDLLKNPVFDEVLMVPAFNSSPAMVANLQVQTHFLLSSAELIAESAPTLFLDADVLAVQAAPLAEPDWDVLVTQRDHVAMKDGEKVVGVANEMPYNYGVIGANDTLGALEAWIWMRTRVSRMSKNLQTWYGNQWALRELVGGSYKDETPRKVTSENGHWTIKIQVEDCDRWNYTPESEGENLDEKYFLHPKGDRKELFHHYAELLA